MHDEFCPAKDDPTRQDCAVCVVIAKARADEQERIARALEVYDFIDGDKAAEIARNGGRT